MSSAVFPKMQQQAERPANIYSRMLEQQHRGVASPAPVRNGMQEQKPMRDEARRQQQQQMPQL